MPKDRRKGIYYIFVCDTFMKLFFNEYYTQYKLIKIFNGNSEYVYKLKMVLSRTISVRKTKVIICLFTVVCEYITLML